MKKILAIMANGVEEFEAIGTIDICRRAGIHVDVYGLDSSTVNCIKGTVITNLLVLNSIDVTEYDLLFLPGGPHYKILETSLVVIELIKEFYNSNKLIAAICAAPSILGRLGLLKNKNYTCFESLNSDFHGTYTKEYSTIDLPFITGKSVAAVLEFSFNIIDVLVGKEITQNIKKSIYYIE